MPYESGGGGGGRLRIPMRARSLSRWSWLMPSGRLSQVNRLGILTHQGACCSVDAGLTPTLSNRASSVSTCKLEIREAISVHICSRNSNLSLYKISPKVPQGGWRG